ncbi:hypothetical protein LTR17_023481 [Elasticomyces elasticus]|nr:hypothetical protein LTR17_023481 [Elasticomyces elasticus]
MISQDDDFTLSDDPTPQEPEQSQDSQAIAIDTTSIQQMLEQHKQNLKQRRSQRNADIKAAHKRRVEKLNKAAEHAKAKYHETRIATRRPKIERLLQMLEKKRHIQAKIDHCAEQKEAAFAGMAQKFQLAIDARCAALEQMRS